MDPLGQRVERGMCCVVQAEVERQLAPCDHLVEERGRFGRRRVLKRRARDFGRAQLAVSEVGRQPARAVAVGGVCAPSAVLLQPGLDEVSEPGAARAGATLGGHRAHRAIHLAAGDDGGDVRASDVEGVDRQAGEERGRKLAARCAIEDRLERDVAQLRELRPDGSSRVLFTGQHRRGNHTNGIHRHHPARRTRRETRGALRRSASRIRVSDDEAGSRGKPLDRTCTLSAAGVQDEPERVAHRSSVAGDVTRTLQGEGVHAIGRVLVVRVELVDDEEWPVQPIGFDRRIAKRPVFMDALGARHQVENEFAFWDEPHLVDAGAPLRELVAHIGRAEWMHTACNLKDDQNVPLLSLWSISTPHRV